MVMIIVWSDFGFYIPELWMNGRRGRKEGVGER
jgi:hypothetical protein